MTETPHDAVMAEERDPYALDERGHPDDPDRPTPAEAEADEAILRERKRR